jgi:hypothetical protein
LPSVIGGIQGGFGALGLCIGRMYHCNVLYSGIASDALGRIGIEPATVDTLAQSIPVTVNSLTQ